LCVPTIGEDLDAVGRLIKSAIERPGGSYADEVVLAFPEGVQAEIPGVVWTSEWRGTTWRGTPVLGVTDPGGLDATTLWNMAFEQATGVWRAPGIPGTVYDPPAGADDPRAVSLHDFLRALPDEVTDLWGPLTFTAVAPGVPRCIVRAPVFVRWGAGFVWAPPPSVVLVPRPNNHGVSGEHPSLSRTSDVAMTFSPVPVVWSDRVPSLVPLLHAARLSLAAGDALASLEHGIWATIVDSSHPGGYFEAATALAILREAPTALTVLRKGFDRTKGGLPIRAASGYTPNTHWYFWLAAQMAAGEGSWDEAIGFLKASVAMQPWRCVVDQIPVFERLKMTAALEAP